jgi:hypothetical protein
MARGPLLRIVGGLMEASNDTSTQPYMTINQWGIQTPLRHVIGGCYCFTTIYGNSSYGRLSIYLSEDGEDMVVGGKIWANNDTQSNSPVEQSSWGYTGANTKLIKSAFSCYGYSTTYQHGYLNCDLYMAANPSGPYPIGGRYYSTNDTSSAPNLTDTFWGFSDGNENELLGGYNWSAAYQKGYGHATIVLSP